MKPRLFATALAAVLSVGGAFAPVAAAQPAVPDAPVATAAGVAPADVASTDVDLVDTARSDPWTGAPERALALTVDSPTNATTERSLPVVLFSPGFMVPRDAYRTLTRDLASRGYVVLSVDHTGDAVATRFADGRVVPMQLPDPYSDATLQRAIDTRVADLGFVADALRAGTAPLPAGVAAAADPSRLGVFGHSLGGASAAEFARTDARVGAAVNLDGALFYGSEAAPVATQGNDRPLLNVVTDVHAASPEGRERYLDSYLSTPRAWSRVYALADTRHMSFTDAETLVPQFVPDPPGQDVPGGFGLGSAPRQEVADTTHDLTAGMFDRFLRGKDVAWLDDAAGRYPLVSEVR
nr:hypothetical protein [Rhodococcus sp. HNM0569]